MKPWTQRSSREDMRSAELSRGGWREVVEPKTGETDPANIY